MPWPRPNPGVAPLALPCRCPGVALPGTTDPDSIGKWTTTTLPTIDNNHQPTTNEPTTNHHGPTVQSLNHCTRLPRTRTVMTNTNYLMFLFFFVSNYEVPKAPEEPGEQRISFCITLYTPLLFPPFSLSLSEFVLSFAVLFLPPFVCLFNCLHSFVCYKKEKILSLSVRPSIRCLYLSTSLDLSVLRHAVSSFYRRVTCRHVNATTIHALSYVVYFRVSLRFVTRVRRREIK